MSELLIGNKMQKVNHLVAFDFHIAVRIFQLSGTDCCVQTASQSKGRRALQFVTSPGTPAILDHLYHVLWWHCQTEIIKKS